MRKWGLDNEMRGMQIVQKKGGEMASYQAGLERRNLHVHCRQSIERGNQHYMSFI